MSDDLKGYESGPLDPEERRRVRRDAMRTNALWSIFGPVATLVRDWKFWTAALVVLAWLNRPEIADALQVLIGSAS